jgi:hypothetical protein
MICPTCGNDTLIDIDDFFRDDEYPYQTPPVDWCSSCGTLRTYRFEERESIYRPSLPKINGASPFSSA